MGAPNLKVVGRSAARSGEHACITQPSPASAPSLCRTAPLVSTEEYILAQEVTDTLLGALSDAGLSRSDLPAIWDCSETRARAKLDPSNDRAPITGRDLFRLRLRAPEAWEAWQRRCAALGVEEGSGPCGR